MSPDLPVLARDRGTPLFVYDGVAVQERIEAVRAAFEGEVDLLYATKANSHPDLLTRMAPRLDGADVTSSGALRAAVESGFAGPTVQFTSPGKSESDLTAALEAGASVVIGCSGEALDLATLAVERGLDPASLPVLARVNPRERIHAFRSAAGGVPSPFGIPEEDVDHELSAVRATGLRPRGLHVHRGSQCTSATAFSKHVDQTLALAEDLHSRHGLPLHINLGGGLGVAPQGSPQLPLESLGHRVARSLRAFRRAYPSATFAIEPGRYLVAEAGTLLLRVLRRRVVRGTTFIVLDGGIDVFLFATERMRHGPPPPIINLSRPEATVEPVTLVGPACSSEDTLVVGLSLPRVQSGDVLAVGHAGAYAAGASISGFLGRAPAQELVVD